MELHAVVRLSCVSVKVLHEVLIIALHPVIYIMAIMRKVRCMHGCACEDIQALLRVTPASVVFFWLSKSAACHQQHSAKSKCWCLSADQSAT